MKGGTQGKREGRRWTAEAWPDMAVSQVDDKFAMLSLDLPVIPPDAFLVVLWRQGRPETAHL